MTLSAIPRSSAPKPQESPVTTLAQQFGAEYARGVVPQMLKSIDSVRRNSAWIARGALAVTTPHQVLYIGSLGHGSLVEVISAWAFAVLIPAVTDLGMLTMLRITQTRGLHRQARRRALLVLALLVAESATVNAIAPGHAVFRVLVAFAAVVLALVEWVHASIRPDFEELEVEEQAVAPAPAVDEALEQKLADRRERDRQRRAAKRETDRLAAEAEAQKKADAAERRRLARQVADLETSFAAESAPVSPAPIGENASYL